MADMPQKRSYQRRTPYNNKNRQMKNETLSSDTKVFALGGLNEVGKICIVLNIRMN